MYEEVTPVHKTIEEEQQRCKAGVFRIQDGLPEISCVPCCTGSKIRAAISWKILVPPLRDCNCAGLEMHASLSWQSSEGCLLTCNCYRRQAFADVYAEQAQQMAERMAKLRAKERDKREAFRKHVLPFIPTSILNGLALQQQPPHCQISLPAQPRISPAIVPADLQKIGPSEPLVRHIQNLQ